MKKYLFSPLFHYYAYTIGNSIQLIFYTDTLKNFIIDVSIPNIAKTVVGSYYFTSKSILIET